MPRIFKESDFSDNIHSAAPPKSISDYLMGLADQAGLGVMERSDQPPAGIGQNLARFSGTTGPTVAGGMLGAALGSTVAPGAGTYLGGVLGAAAGRSLQNLNQDVSNIVSPGSARQITNQQRLVEPIGAGASYAAAEGLGGIGKTVSKTVGPTLMRGLAGIKQDIGSQLINDLGVLFRAPSVREAGDAINMAAKKNGVKTMESGLKESTELLSNISDSYGFKVKPTNLFSDSMADDFVENGNLVRVLNDPASPLTDREKLQIAISGRQAITNALQAAKFGTPPGAVGTKIGMNKTTYIKAIDQLDNIITEHAPEMLDSLHGYRDAIVKESVSGLSKILPRNANQTTSRLGGAMMAGLGVDATRRTSEGRSPGADLMLMAAISPLSVGIGLRGAYLAGMTGIPQVLTKMGMAAGGQALNGP